MMNTPQKRSSSSNLNLFNVSDIRSSLPPASRTPKYTMSLSSMKDSLDTLEQVPTDNDVSMKDVDVSEPYGYHFGENTPTPSSYSNQYYRDIHGSHFHHQHHQTPVTNDIEMEDASPEHHFMDQTPSRKPRELSGSKHQLSRPLPIANEKLTSTASSTENSKPLPESDKSKFSETPKKQASSSSSSTSRFLLSPTRAGAELALYKYSPQPSSESDNYPNASSDSSKPVLSSTNHSQTPKRSFNSNPNTQINPNYTNQKNESYPETSGYTMGTLGLGPRSSSSPSLPTPTPAWISAVTQQLNQQHELQKEQFHHDQRQQKIALAPYIISSYLQIASNFALAGLVAYALIKGYKAFQHDVTAKLVQRRADIITAAHRCAREYVRNECRPDVRAPMMEDLCTQWEICMDLALPFTEQDGDGNYYNGNSDDNEQGGGIKKMISSTIYKLGSRGGINSHDGDLHHFAYFPAVAETLADTANAFFEPVTIKSLIVFIILILGAIYTSNFAFGYLRAKAYYGQNMQNVQYIPISAASVAATPATTGFNKNSNNDNRDIPLESDYYTSSSSISERLKKRTLPITNEK